MTEEIQTEVKKRGRGRLAGTKFPSGYKPRKNKVVEPTQEVNTEVKLN